MFHSSLIEMTRIHFKEYMYRRLTPRPCVNVVLTEWPRVSTNQVALSIATSRHNGTKQTQNQGQFGCTKDAFCSE
jgi:hypothetical protein